MRPSDRRLNPRSVEPRNNDHTTGHFAARWLRRIEYSVLRSEMAVDFNDHLAGDAVGVAWCAFRQAPVQD
jgi:hypothetical protein